MKLEVVLLAMLVILDPVILMTYSISTPLLSCAPGSGLGDHKKLTIISVTLVVIAIARSRCEVHRRRGSTCIYAYYNFVLILELLL